MTHSYTWAALLGLLATAGVAQAQPAVAFSSANIFITFSQPGYITAADVNGDGRLDLLTCNFHSNSVGVMLGTGTGRLGAAVTYSVGAGSCPAGIAVADVNGDGKLDLLTASNTYGWVGVLPGTGTGTFGPMLTYSAGGPSPRDLMMADINGDNRLDVLVVNDNSRDIEVLLGTAAGSLGVATAYSTGGNSSSGAGAVADVNGDGKLDVLTANYNSNTVSVLLGTGTGSFGAPSTFSTGTGLGSEPNGIAVADVNADSKPDLLTTNSYGDTVGVLLGTGTGSFGIMTSYSMGTGSYPIGIAVADVNGDGEPDVLTANYGTNTVGVLLGTGTTGFGAMTTFNAGTTGIVGIAAADMNGDHRPDLLTANDYNGTVGVLLNMGTYTPLATSAALAAEAVALYPNPAHGRLHVDLPAGTTQVALFDALGRVVRQQAAAGPSLTLDTEGLAAGVYSLRLQAGDATVARRVVLE